MSTQTAFVVHTIGQPVTSVSDWPVPEPGKGQIQVRVTVGALNPHDQKGRDAGLFIKDQLPAILGNDVAGVVTAIGEATSRFKVGDHIFGQAMAREEKALQQFIVLEEAYASLIPDGFSDDACVTLPTNLMAGK
jgi:NADPH:quinone reductase